MTQEVVQSLRCQVLQALEQKVSNNHLLKVVGEMSIHTCGYTHAHTHMHTCTHMHIPTLNDFLTEREYGHIYCLEVLLK